MKKIMLVFGTRPEAIKMAPLCHAFRERKDVNTIVCVTGQHREMLDQVLDIFDLVPDIDLDLMEKGQSLFDITASVVLNMGKVFAEYEPDLVLVHGDTATTLATSIAAFYSDVKVAHVEAGLRTFDLHAPFPEEFNRKVTSIAANFHFAPTELSRSNLLAEGVGGDNIWVTGNTVIDSLYWILDKINCDLELRGSLNDLIGQHLDFKWEKYRFVLITGHRRENFGGGFLSICEAIKSLAVAHPDVRFVYPVHLNPNVQNPVNNLLANLDNVYLIPPLDYEPFVMLLKHCYLVLTDSGGIQEEAPSLGKPVLVMRNVTERPEAVDAGTVKLVGANAESIVSNIDQLLTDTDTYAAMSRAHNPYGDGSACSKIVKIIMEKL